MINPEEDDARIYEQTPSLLSQLRASPEAQTGGVPQGLPQSEPDDPDFGDMGIDTSTQLLEAILVELRQMNQALRELA